MKKEAETPNLEVEEKHDDGDSTSDIEGSDIEENIKRQLAK